MPVLRNAFFTILVSYSLVGFAHPQADIEERLKRIEEKLDRLLSAQGQETKAADINNVIAEQSCEGQLLDKEFFVICHNNR